MEEQQFVSKVKNVKGPREHKVTGSWGVYDAYKWYRKHKPSDKKYILTESQYFSIIREINNRLRDSFVKGNDIKLPCRLGRLEVRKYPAVITSDGNRIKTNLPIDWDATLKLWYEEPKYYEEKFLVRVNVPEIYRVYYNKATALYNNKSFYQFSPNRELKKGLKHSIREDSSFDAFIK
jgi:hypothetical protein